jgi:hypothetical protein
MKFKYAILVAATGLGLSGCATVMHGPNQTLELGSDPQGASVKLSNGGSCVTPCKLEVPRRHDLRADFSLDGYRPVYVLLQSRLGSATFGNLIAGGIIGAVVDSSNGSSNKIAPNPVNVRMTANGQTTAEMMLDKKGKDNGTVDAHNDSVRVDVAKSIGADAAGMPAAVPAPAPVGN